MISLADLHKSGTVEVGQRYMARGGGVFTVVRNLDGRYELETPIHSYVTISGTPIPKEYPKYDERSANLFLVGRRKIPREQQS